MLPDIYMVARLDGRSFTRLTKEVHQFEAPFDTRFNPRSGQKVLAARRRIKRDLELPMKDAYSDFIRALTESNHD